MYRTSQSVLFALTICALGLQGSLAQTLLATCNVAPNSATPPSDQQPVFGTVTLAQDAAGGDTLIRIAVEGFDTTDEFTQHGFHVHGSGDLSNGCQSTGGHYNPFGVNHGAPTAAIRHVGDLGNIEEDAFGGVFTTLTDSRVSLSGEYSVIGRAIVIHEKTDDLGLGGDDGSITTGNAGSRLACCVISEVEAMNAAPSSVTVSLATIFLSVLGFFLL